MSAPEVRVYPTDFGDFVVSLDGMWIPGAYETEEAAKKSAELYDADLDKWVAAYGNEPIKVAPQKSALRKALHDAQKKYIRGRR